MLRSGSVWSLGRGLSLELHGPEERQRLHLHPIACWQVAAEYGLVHRAMVEPPVRDYLPTSWTNLAHVKAEHFRALAHYHTAVALCETSCECHHPTRPSVPAEAPLLRLVASLTPRSSQGKPLKAGAHLPALNCL